MATPRWISVYDLLKQMAAESVRPISYGQLAVMLRVWQGRPCHRRYLAGMLARVYQQCTATGEPDLTAFVVGKAGVPGTGWAGWQSEDDPEAVRKAGHVHFRQQVWGR